MAGAIDKKRNDVAKELAGAPSTHVAARSGILDSITLSREFAHAYLKALCEALEGGRIVDGTPTTMSLHQVCSVLAQQRMVCYGAFNISKQSRKFDFPKYETVNGALGLSEPNTSFMGIKATNLEETYTVNLSTDPTKTQTQDSNTFSVYVGDYYLVRSRATGELLDVADDVEPYTKPDGDTVFGNAIGWGSSVSSEEEANTWNYNWARANIESVTTQSAGAYNELTVLRLEDHLTPASFTTVLRQEDTGLDYSSYIETEGSDLLINEDGSFILMNWPFDAICNTTNADATVTMDSTAELSVGLSVSGTGITAGTTVASITNATTFELSANATATNANQRFIFGGNVETDDPDDFPFEEIWMLMENGDYIISELPVLSYFMLMEDGEVFSTTGDYIVTEDGFRISYHERRVATGELYDFAGYEDQFRIKADHLTEERRDDSVYIRLQEDGLGVRLLGEESPTLSEDHIRGAFPYETFLATEDHYFRTEDPTDSFKILFEDDNKSLMEDSQPLSANTYVPLGPSFGSKFYLKRQADAVNTFTIIGTTTVDSVEVTGISDADIEKIKYGDVISGTGIPDDNVSIAAVQTADSKIRLSNTGIATANGIINLTVNSVPFSHAKNDIFCQIEIVAEGLVTNDNWKPIGDEVGGYSGTSSGPDDLLVANTTQFIDMLGFFNPGTAGSSDLVKGSSAKYSSEGKEYNGINYPDIEVNPFKPATQGTTKARETKEGELIGTQPDGLGDKDIWCGRFVAWNKDRQAFIAGATVAVGEYRYIIDNAEKYFYAPSRNESYSGGTMSVGADPHDPARSLAKGSTANYDGVIGAFEKEPRATLPRTGLATVIANINSTTSVSVPGGGSGATAYSPATVSLSAGAIPVDTATTFTGSTSGVTQTGIGSTATYAWTTSPPNSATLGTFYTLTDNLVIRNQVYYDVSYSPAGAQGDAAGDSWTSTVGVRRAVFNCSHNFYRQFVISDPNYSHLFISVEALKGVAKLRDPNVDADVAIAPRDLPTGTGSSEPGISDQAFEDYILSNTIGGRTAWEQSVDVLNSVLALTRSTLSSQGRTGLNNGGNGLGSNVPITNPALADGFSSFLGETAILLNTCNYRINEIDARIGIPKYSGSQSLRGTAPGIYVEKIPSSNTSGGLIPYGRSIYNTVNHLLGTDVDLMGGIIKDIESLTDLIDSVKTARNKYEIFSGRDKVY